MTGALRLRWSSATLRPKRTVPVASSIQEPARAALVHGAGAPADLGRRTRAPRPERGGVDLAELRPDQIWESAKSLRRTVANLRVPTYQDGAPILGKDPRIPGLFHAVTSNGYTLGPLVGRITADLVDRDATDRDVRVFSVARFSDAAAGAPVSAPQ